MAGTAGAGGMAPPTSTRISARLKHFQEHSSPVNVLCALQSIHSDRHGGHGVRPPVDDVQLPRGTHLGVEYPCVTSVACYHWLIPLCDEHILIPLYYESRLPVC